MNRKKGKIITVTSTKGGIGKTITTLNLAGIYHKLNKKVLVIDMDLYSGSVATYLNLDGERTIYNLVDDLTYNRYEALENYIVKHNENIDIIPAPKDPRLANKIDSRYVPLIFNNVIYKYDIILVDTNHILNDVNIVALDNSDTILYMFTNDVFDIKNTKNFMSIIKDVGYKNVVTVLNNSIFYERNYFTMYDIRNIIKTNIDFTLPKSLYIKNIDKYIMDGEILVLSPNLTFRDKKDYEKLVELAKSLIKEDKNEENTI